METYGVPAEKVIRLKKTFYKYDINGDGFIDRHELYANVRILGGKASKEELDEMINEVSPNGIVSLPAFLTMFGYGHVTEQLRDTFQKSDVSGKGKLSTQEFRTLIGYDRVRELFQLSGKRLGDNVTFDEFVALMFFGSPLRKFDQLPKIPGVENLPVQTISKVRSLFFEMDVNSDGLLSPAELHKLLKKGGLDITLEQAKGFIDEVDRDGDRELNLLEFMELMGHDAEVALYWEAFRALDEDLSGSLNQKEMRRGMKTMDIKHARRETEKLFDSLGVQEINFNQFVEWMVRLDSEDTTIE